MKKKICRAMYGAMYGAAYAVALVVMMAPLTACESGESGEAKSGENRITAFSVNGVAGVIHGETIAVTLPEGSAVQALAPEIAVSAGASVSPASGVARDFSGTVDYAVTAENGDTRRYRVTVTVAAAPETGENRITAFSVNGVAGVIDETAITVTLPEGSAVQALAPEIAVSAGASVSPASGVARDFRGTVNYTVSAKNGDTRTYAVSVLIEGGGAAAEDTVIAIAHLGNGGPAAKLTALAGSGAAELVIGSAEVPYSDPPVIEAFTLPPDAAAALAGAAAVAARFETSAPASVSLAYAHYVREAVRAANPDAAVTVNAPHPAFTPHFNGKDWWTAADLSNTNLYAAYDSRIANGQDMALIDGIRLARDSGGKYVFVYDRTLTVSKLVWQNSESYGWADPEVPFRGFGLQKGSGTIPDSSVHGMVVLRGRIGEEEDGDISSFPVVHDWETYRSALAEAGLLPSAGRLLDHRKVEIQSAGSNANIMSNGIYDFILAYYNPNASGAAVGGASGGADMKELLPQWLPAAGLTVNGGENGEVSSRDIGGVPSANPNRKGASGSSGAPNQDFTGNITVPMANYLISSLHVSEFQNTNIIGDGVMWGTYDVVGKDIVLPHITNVGLIGNYYGVVVNNRIGGRIRGVLDIQGTAPNMLDNDEKEGYLNLWDVSHDMGANRFHVVCIKDVNGAQYFNVQGGWSNDPQPANVVMYATKYNATDIANEVSYLKPSYRAFLDGANAQTGAPKIMPVDAAFANAASYKGAVVSSSGAPDVAPLDEAAWIAAANANNGAAPPFVPYNAAPALDATAFAAIAVSAAPPSVGSRLADGSRPLLEAALPKKPRFAPPPRRA